MAGLGRITNALTSLRRGGRESEPTHPTASLEPPKTRAEYIQRLQLYPDSKTTVSVTIGDAELMHDGREGNGFTIYANTGIEGVSFTRSFGPFSTTEKELYERRTLLTQIRLVRIIREAGFTADIPTQDEGIQRNLTDEEIEKLKAEAEARGTTPFPL